MTIVVKLHSMNKKKTAKEQLGYELRWVEKHSK